MSRRVGILGGTFDPIHCGHVDLAAAAAAALDLSPLWFIPSNIPPHRQPTTVSGFHRFAMVALAVTGRTGWQVSDMELAHHEPSFTSHTLGRLHAQGYAPPELFFVIGADAFGDIATWRHYPEILDAAHFVVVSRPGRPVGALRRHLPALAERMIEPPVGGPAGQTSIILIDATTADVSSTEVRRRCEEGRSNAGLVPQAVDQYIEQHGLYSSGSPKHEAAGNGAASTAGRLHGQGR